MIYMSYIALWLLWPIWRTLLTRSPHFNFSYDGVHHGDAGFGVLAHGLAVDNWYEIIIGLLAVVDDTIGHWRSAHGGKEAWIIEAAFMPLYRVFYKWTTRK